MVSSTLQKTEYQNKIDIDHEEKILEVIDIIEPTPVDVNLSPYGHKFPKSAHDCRVFYVISADFDTDRRKNRQLYNNFKNRIRFRYKTVVKSPCLRLSGTDIGTQQ